MRSGAAAARDDMARQSAQADLTTMWKALEADAALIEALVTPMVKPQAVPTIEELQRAVTGAFSRSSRRTTRSCMVASCAQG